MIDPGAFLRSLELLTPVRRGSRHPFASSSASCTAKDEVDQIGCSDVILRSQTNEICSACLNLESPVGDTVPGFKLQEVDATCVFNLQVGDSLVNKGQMHIACGQKTQPICN